MNERPISLSDPDPYTGETYDPRTGHRRGHYCAKSPNDTHEAGHHDDRCRWCHEPMEEAS